MATKGEFVMRYLLLCICALLALAVPAQARSSAPPPVGHVFVIVLENENASTTFGPNSPAPYLSKTLPTKGAYVPDYYGVTHESLGNYVAMVSGQGSNPQTQADCQIYSAFVGTVFGLDGQLLGDGCVYPTSVKTIADQLTAKGLSWKGYMEDMGNDTTREAALCGRPQLNTRDNTQSATPTDQYAARHNPFVYFHSIVDDGVYCEQHDVPLSQLPADLSKSRTTPSLSFITPDLCNDGHDGNGTPGSCADGGPGGLPAADSFLQTWVPRITGSAAFKRDGLLVITFDEAEGDPQHPESADASACCNEAQFPNTPNNGGPIPGMGGGKVGAVVLSPFIRGGTVTSTPYNHFSLLRSFEGLLGLPYLGYANTPNPGSFGTDVFTGTW
jgi:phosphatidylinositol-3-phosphatase